MSEGIDEGLKDLAIEVAELLGCDYQEVLGGHFVIAKPFEPKQHAVVGMFLVHNQYGIRVASVLGITVGYNDGVMLLNAPLTLNVGCSVVVPSREKLAEYLQMVVNYCRAAQDEEEEYAMMELILGGLL